MKHGKTLPWLSWFIKKGVVNTRWTLYYIIVIPWVLCTLGLQCNKSHVSQLHAIYIPWAQLPWIHSRERKRQAHLARYNLTKAALSVRLDSRSILWLPHDWRVWSILNIAHVTSIRISINHRLPCHASYTQAVAYRRGRKVTYCQHRSCYPVSLPWYLYVQ